MNGEKIYLFLSMSHVVLTVTMGAENSRTYNCTSAIWIWNKERIWRDDDDSRTSYVWAFSHISMESKSKNNPINTLINIYEMVTCVIELELEERRGGFSPYCIIFFSRNQFPCFQTTAWISKILPIFECWGYMGVFGILIDVTNFLYEQWTFRHLLILISNIKIQLQQLYGKFSVLILKEVAQSCIITPHLAHHTCCDFKSSMVFN